MLEKNISFKKMPKLVKLQKDSRLKLSYNDKLNTKTPVEMAGILCKVIMLTADASGARKTGESKELVFVKMLENGYQGFVPINFLMKFQRPRFPTGVENKQGLFKNSIGSLSQYIQGAWGVLKTVFLKSR